MMPNRDVSNREPQYKEMMSGHAPHQGQITPAFDPPVDSQANADPYTNPDYNQPPGLLENQTSQHHRFSPETKACIDECLHCHKACLSEAMNHCLESGGAHIEPAHFRLLMSCAEVCQTSANFGLMNSPFYVALSSVCAQVCEACAKSCDDVEGMTHCAATCRECAHLCLNMARMAN